jgi:hypothetical protein
MKSDGQHGRVNSFDRVEINNSDLRGDQVPDGEAEWPAIWEFALTFDGYSHWGSTERCADIANSRRNETLTELRTCLFFEQRRYHHFGQVPHGDDEKYVRELVSAIRHRVQVNDRR